MTSTDPFAHDDAAYVLGALSPEQRRAFEEHLEDCERCRRAVSDLAGIPGLLGRMDESAFAEPDELPPLPDTMLPELLRVVRRRRRTRVIAAAGVAAAVVLVFALGALVRGGGDAHEPAAGQVMTQVDQTQLEATVTLQQVAWGTKLHLACSYAGELSGYEPVSYALEVRTTDGATQRLITWRAVPGRTIQLDAGTDADADDIARVDVVAVGSESPVLTLSPSRS